jgi:drug/metabolite transporter (DMT)-like permease
MPLVAVGQLVILGAIWGASFLFIKIGVSEMGPMTFAAIRVLIGSLTLAVALGVRRQRLPRDLRVWGRLLVMGVLGTAIPFAAISWGTQYIASGLSAILNATMPLFTVVLAAAWGDETMTPSRLIGVCIGFAGIVVLTLPKLAGGLHLGVLGELAIVVAAMSYAVAIVYARHALADQPPLVASFGQIGTSFLVLVPVALLERPALALPSAPVIGSLLAVGILGTGVAYIIYYRLLQSVGATSTSLVTYITPLFAIFWGLVLLGERLSWHAFVALALIFLGLIFVNRRSARARVAQPAPVTESEG